MICYYLLPCLLGFLVCFVSNTVARHAIIAGNVAVIGDFPYQVSLQYANNHFCGGGIIGEEFVLTAGHCVIGDNNQFFNHSITVVAGASELHRRHPPAEVVKVHKIYVPLDFDRTAIIGNGDIAVLQLRHPLKLSLHGNMQKVKLPKNQNDVYAGKTAIIAGYGWDWIGINTTTRIGKNRDGRLRYALTDVLPNNQCLVGISDGNTIEMPDKQICARIRHHHDSQWKGVCTGDSGGLLVDENRFAIGVLSNGPAGCTERNRPGSYTRISHYLTFIRNAKEGRTTKNMRELELRE